MATRLHLYRLQRSSNHYKAIKALYEEQHHEILEDVEELVHWAVNSDIIDAVEGADILEFAETGELFGDVGDAI